ncbi:hypothetical protein ELE00_34720, partial [Klebsiella pneumoniae]|nr:hypothetical protein [Klebsiella pneumoniae]
KIDHFVLSESIFYRGIKELIEKRIIAKTNEKNWYFINPAIVFNGDRARFVSEIIKKKEVMEGQTENTVSTRDMDNNAEVKSRSIASVIEDVNDQEDIDLLIARLQAKRSQAKMMDVSADGAIATKGEMLLYPEETLEWDNIHGEDFLTKMTFSDRVR